VSPKNRRNHHQQNYLAWLAGLRAAGISNYPRGYLTD
jgi:hypothetical protein